MKKIFSILMTFLLLASSSGITYAQHFCGEYKMVSEITLGEKHLSCGMAMSTPGCDDEEKEHDCCDNEYLNVDTDDTFTKANIDDISLEMVFVASFVSVFVLRLQELDISANHNYVYYDPPPLERDLNILYVTFLI